LVKGAFWQIPEETDSENYRIFRGMKGNLRFILLILALLSTSLVYSQKTKSMGRQVQPDQLLQDARRIMEDAPTKAIKLVEEAIRSTRNNKGRDRSTEYEAYVLLGNIYEQIEQYELALQRYEQATSTLGKNAGERLAEVQFYRGRSLLALERLDEAERNFSDCLQNSKDPSLRVRCLEGITDVTLKKNNADQADVLLDSIESNYPMDSIGKARNAARRSQVYLQQDRYGEASESFKNSLNTLPKNQQIEESDFAPIQQAQKEILDYSGSSNAEKIEAQSNVTSNYSRIDNSEEQRVIENLKIADLYEKESNYPEAEKFVAASKTLIKPGTKAAVAAEVYKKSADLNQRKGQVNAALDDLEKYIAAKEQAILDEELALRDQVEIVKGQKQIDIQEREYDLEEKDRALLASQLRTQRIIIGLLSFVLLASLVYFYFLYKNIQAKRQANQLLLLKSLRTQMNPHFIFNALNSVNNFIAKNDEKAANKFLVEFSRLMRKVLDYSQRDFISFEEEIELNQLYLKLEQYRFRDKFEYTFENEVTEKAHQIEVPPMLIQPFIENAVWHGLRYKTSPGKLDVRIYETNDQLIISIRDNGIGREKSKALKTENQKAYRSTGLANVNKRIDLINDIYQKNYNIQVTDAEPGSEDVGTLVKIIIPYDHKNA
jgi:anti-sigma regulatory factor (Ser/Thr protein kinase)